MAAPLAGCLALLLCGAPAGALKLVFLEDGAAAGNSTDSGASACLTAETGSPCHQKVRWTMKHGIKEHAESFKPLTTSSTFEEVQEHLHGMKKFAGICRKPCARRGPLADRARRGQASLPAPGRVGSEAAEPCRIARRGDACFEGVVWAMQRGIQAHPEWYPGLGENSSFREFQEVLSKQVGGACRRPCADACHTAVEGDECFKKVTWAMREGIAAHPERFPSLTKDSSFEEFQNFLHGGPPPGLVPNDYACARACSRQPGQAQSAPPGQAPAVADTAKKALEQTAEPAPPLAIPPAAAATARVGGGAAAAAAVVHGEEPLYEDEKKESAVSPEVLRRRAAPSLERSQQQAYYEDEEKESAVGSEALRQKAAEEEPFYEDEKEESAVSPEVLRRRAAPSLERSQQQAYYEDEEKESAEALRQKSAEEAAELPDEELSGASNATMIRVPLAAPPQPLRRGCYAWQPEGCPLQGENSVPVDWKLDALEAIDTQAACFMRKQHFDTFCGTRSTKMVFVPEDRAAETGAPEKASAEERDVDTYVVSGPDDSNTSTVLGPAGQEGSAERAAGGLVGRIVEPAALHEGLPEWWSLIVAGAPQESFSLVSRPPESPGCYFYVPAGCQGQDPSPPGWKLDVLGKRLFRKDLDKKDTACALRKVFYDRWCHANDTMMARVPALAAEEESTPAAPDKAVAVELAKPVAFAASRKRRPILNLQAQALEEE